MKKRRLSIGWNNEIHIGRGILRIALFVVCLVAGCALFRELYQDMKSQENSENSSLQKWLEHSVSNVWMPGVNVWQQETQQNDYNPLERLVLENFPVLLYSMEQPQGYPLEALQESSYEELLILEGSDEDRKGIDEASLEYGEDAIHLDKSLEEAFLTENGFITENQAAGKYEEEAENNKENIFYEVEEPAYRYQWDELQDYEDLVKAFYAIDSTTTAGAELLNTEKLLSKDMTLQGQDGEPQILIYHTHSQEGFADSISGDDSTTIVGAGEKLAQILHDKYGYQVIHHTGSYDKETRDDAYANALPDIEELLAGNPSIEVVIDLHRDEMPADRRLVVDMQGRPTAQFMFFNGLCRTAKRGALESLENPYLDDNLAFSFQMQTAANEYYPGITRRIYLKAYRYNMHLCPKSLLIELGAQNNTVEEIMNAIEPLAHVIHLVLAGEEPDVD